MDNPNINSYSNLSSEVGVGQEPPASFSAQEDFWGSAQHYHHHLFHIKRKRSRCFHRSITFINFWRSRSRYTVFGTLTTKVGSHTLDQIPHYWTILLKRIRHKYLHQFPHFEALKIIDIGSAHGMIHIHFLGNRYLPYDWLSAQWFDITGDSWDVSLSAISSDRLSPRKASGYLAGYINKPQDRYTRTRRAIPKGIVEDWYHIYHRLAHGDKQKAINLYDDWLKNIYRRSWNSWLRKYASHDPQQSILPSYGS